jgi:hypothetical protein
MSVDAWFRQSATDQFNRNASLRKTCVLSAEQKESRENERRRYGSLGVESDANLAAVFQLLRKEQDRLKKELHGISAALAAFGKSYGKQAGTRTLSAAGRARIGAAQRARWAKVRAGKSQSRNGTAAPKRPMSAAARKRIAAAQRARWTKVRTAKK